MNLGLAGKRAIVTGGSRGIGKRIARQLALEGVDVAIAARGRAALDETAEEIRAETERTVVPLVADMRDDDSVKMMVGSSARELGGIDILVNNAAVPGGRKVAAIADMRVPELLEDINVKLGGYLRAARSVAPYMVAAGWGRIINIGGLAARLTGNYNAAIRSATISALTKNLADELGPKGIGTVAVHPGAMRDLIADPDSQRRFAAATSNGELFDASAIAWLVTVLCSPHNVALNGETLQAGGGVRGFINY
jgi:NAD(P)-dependent dehydrogenase (short-subunit alcohol dehydrogenase family)